MLPKRLTPLHYVASLFTVASLVYYISNRKVLKRQNKDRDLEFWLYISSFVIFFIAYSYSIFPYYDYGVNGTKFTLSIIVLFLYILYSSFKDKEK